MQEYIFIGTDYRDQNTTMYARVMVHLPVYIANQK